MVKVLLYGLQRSGTNFLENILKKNYRICFLNSDDDRKSPLQKHFRIYKNKTIIPEPQYCNDIFIETIEQFESLFKDLPDYYLIISKDPYSWYLSYKRWAKKCKWPEVNHHYIEEYNLFYGAFIELCSKSDKVIFIRYVDLIKDPSSVLKVLENKMNLKKKLLARFILDLPDKVPQSEDFTQGKRAYYLGKHYLEEYSTEDLQALNARLDPHIVSLLGYEYE